MFTGIITDIGTITRVERRGDTRIVVATAYDTATIELGASIACSGVCLTVVDKSAAGQPGWFAVDVSGETIACTAGAQWEEGRRLNLERAMKLGDELGGHIVPPAMSTASPPSKASAPTADSLRIGITVPPALAPFLAAKGSVTIDGDSLTVNEVSDGAGEGGDATDIAINLIPHTQAMTTLGALTPGQTVNVEIDVLARYLRRMEQYRGQR